MPRQKNALVHGRELISISPGRLDVVYEARFARPSMNFAVAPGQVLTSVYNKLSSRWPVASNDVTVASRVNEVRLSDVRVRLTLFNGQGTLEIDADKIGGHFRNAMFPKDLVIMGDCLKIYLDAITEALPNDRVSDHTLKMMMFVKLLKAPSYARTFLNTVMLPQLESFSSGDVFPGLKFELENKQNKSLCQFDMQRAYSSSDELFISANLTTFDGSAIVAVEQRIQYLEKFVRETWEKIGLQVSTTPDAA